METAHWREFSGAGFMNDRPEMRAKWTLLIGTIGLLAAASVAVWLLRRERPVTTIAAAGMPSLCRGQDFEGVTYIVCEVDTHVFDVGIFHADAGGKVYGSLDAFDTAAEQRGAPVLLAMNAGMYHTDMTPVGLLVADGVEKAPLETRDGEGNFFLKPNGVFSIGQDGVARILETGAYASADITPRIATQSGPMLVVDGAIHPRFEESGTSRYIRNGVGVKDAHTIFLAISLREVSLGSFARLFRDGLGCPDALFFDGAISAMSNGRKTLVGGKYPVGPIIAVSTKS